MFIKKVVFFIVAIFVVMLSAADKKPDKTLLFFINPLGAPCQRQIEIVDGISDSLKPLVKIEYISTNNQADRAKFGIWGIRGLPMMIIADSSGKELYRYAPGVQSGKTILEQIKKISK